MTAHVFVVDKETYPVHRDRLFCGVKRSVDLGTKLDLYSDMLCLREGDEVFFYHRRTDEDRSKWGFRGVFEVVGRPFIDTEPIDGINKSTTDLDVDGTSDTALLGRCPMCDAPYSATGQDHTCTNCESHHDQRVLPVRVEIEVKEYYSVPIDDNTAYIDRTDIEDPYTDILWSMLFRKTSGPGRARSVTHLLPWEREKVNRLLERKNDESKSDIRTDSYPDRTDRELITINPQCYLNEDDPTKFNSEFALRAWLCENIDQDVSNLNETIGVGSDVEFFANHIPYGIGGEKVDMLSLEEEENGELIATVIETKKDGAGISAVRQIDRYTKWMAQLVTRGDVDRVRPVLMGSSVSSYAKNKAREIDQSPILVEYEIEGQTVTFEQVFPEPSSNLSSFAT